MAGGKVSQGPGESGSTLLPERSDRSGAGAGESTLGLPARLMLALPLGVVTLGAAYLVVRRVPALWSPGDLRTTLLGFIIVPAAVVLVGALAVASVSLLVGDLSAELWAGLGVVGLAGLPFAWLAVQAASWTWLALIPPVLLAAFGWPLGLRRWRLREAEQAEVVPLLLLLAGPVERGSVTRHPQVAERRRPGPGRGGHEDEKGDESRAA